MTDTTDTSQLPAPPPDAPVDDPAAIADLSAQEASSVQVAYRRIAESYHDDQTQRAPDTIPLASRAILALSGAGWSTHMIAAFMKLSRQRVQEIIRTYDPLRTVRLSPLEVERMKLSIYEHASDLLLSELLAKRDDMGPRDKINLFNALKARAAETRDRVTESERDEEKRAKSAKRVKELSPYQNMLHIARLGSHRTRKGAEPTPLAPVPPLQHHIEANAAP